LQQTKKISVQGFVNSGYFFWLLAVRSIIKGRRMNTFRRDFLKKAGAGLTAGACIATFSEPAQATPNPYSSSGCIDVRAFGAAGDGAAIDTPSINKAIEAATAAGGGTVHFPAGNYLCYSIRMKSNVALQLEQGATIIAADSKPEGQSGGYDEPEPVQPWEKYQDYGHNHWHNSLIWGEDLHDISILGPGRIWGRGLSRANGPDARDPKDLRTAGVGNKSVSLKSCHNVLLKDFQILQGGWFGILATGVDNLTIDNIIIDTNRDGMDIDCCRNVRIVNCAVNSPWDDAIVPKSSFALGYNRDCENMVIANCYVTGAYKLGTMLDGTWQKFGSEDKVKQTGRIKFGTESNGGFKNVAITNCVFEGCQGLALESVDGAILEDFVISNITMRDITSAPLFIRLGARMRGPAAAQQGAIRRVSITNLNSYNASSKYGCIISGIPDNPIEDVRISRIYLQHQGGGTKELAALVPAEEETKYPDPHMFGEMPTQGLFARHVRNLEIDDLRLDAAKPDVRPCFMFIDVQNLDLYRVKANSDAAGAAKVVLENVKDCEIARFPGVKDMTLDTVDRKTF
jgi:polygalacturonase